MTEDDIRYYEKRLAEERGRAKAEDDGYLRSVHARFAEEIEWKIRNLKKGAERGDNRLPSKIPSDLSVN